MPGDPHKLCRPPKNAQRVFRLSETRGRGLRWVSDNGEPGLVFVGLLKPETGDPELDEVFVWMPECDCKIYGTCVRSKAFIFAGEKFQGSAQFVLVRPVKKGKR